VFRVLRAHMLCPLWPTSTAAGWHLHVLTLCLVTATASQGHQPHLTSTPGILALAPGQPPAHAAATAASQQAAPRRHRPDYCCRSPPQTAAAVAAAAAGRRTHWAPVR
jgi:hypothetical protein